MSTPVATVSTVPAVRPAVGAAAEMSTIHTAFRRELRYAPALVASVPHGDRLRAAQVSTHLDLMDRFLHHHHTIEDDLLWPILLERVPTEIAPIVELMESQHETVSQLLVDTVAVRAAWRADGDVEFGNQLAGIYRRLHGALIEHLDAEEHHVMPLVEACVTAKEWARISRRAQRSMPLKDGPRLLGMLAYDGDPEVVRTMLAAVPGSLRGTVLAAGRRAYARHAFRVYGTATP